MSLQLREITSMGEARGFHGRRALVQRFNNGEEVYRSLGTLSSAIEESHVYINKDHGSPVVLWYSNGIKADDAIGYVFAESK